MLRQSLYQRRSGVHIKISCNTSIMNLQTCVPVSRVCPSNQRIHNELYPRIDNLREERECVLGLPFGHVDRIFPSQFLSITIFFLLAPTSVNLHYFLSYFKRWRYIWIRRARDELLIIIKSRWSVIMGLKKNSIL